jgi:hypothetical protein
VGHYAICAGIETEFSWFLDVILDAEDGSNVTAM